MLENSIEFLSWGEVQLLIKDVAAQLWEKFNTLSDIHDMKFIRVRYPFGERVSQGGEFYLHHDGRSELWSKISPKLKEILDYGWRAFPAGILTKGAMEVFLSFEGLKIPRILIRPGMTFSLGPVLDYDFPHFMTEHFYAATSGCQSVVMLPSITHEASSLRLFKKLNVPKKLLKPNDRKGYFNLFQSILDSSGCASSWYSELILFPKELIEKLQTSNEISLYVYQKLWRFTEYWRNHLLYDTVWQQFLYQVKRKLTIDMSIITAASKIILIALGQDPAYVPVNNNKFGPFKEISDAFYDIYRIRYNAPVIMVPGHITTDNPVYFSMHYYDVLNGFQTIKPIKSLDDFKTTEKLVNYFVEYINNQMVSHVDPASGIKNILNNTDFDFFFQKRKYGDIDLIWEEDSRFEGLPHKSKALGFPGSSKFFQGCVRIKQRKEIRNIYR